MGGRQHGLGLTQQEEKTESAGPVSSQAVKDRPFREPRPHQASAEELEAHKAMVTNLTDPIWNDQEDAA